MRLLPVFTNRGLAAVSALLQNSHTSLNDVTFYIPVSDKLYCLQRAQSLARARAFCRAPVGACCLRVACGLLAGGSSRLL
jgi:hypothetical protein